MLRHAAQAGPGYRGRRKLTSPEERSELARQISETGHEPPAYLFEPTTWIDRRAKLFESGEYPDKGITVEDQHLVLLAQRFDLPVPILIEHADSPLQIGFLTHVEARDHELFGTLSLTQEANELIKQSGAKSLSLGISADLSEIREVSLVRHPRIADAELFSAELIFAGSLLTDLPGQDWKAKYEQLQFQLQQSHAKKRLDEFVQAGKLLPVQIPFVEAMLKANTTLEFCGTATTLQNLLFSMIEKQPPSWLFQEHAFSTKTGDQDFSGLALLPEEVEFYQRHFPDIKLDEIARKKQKP